MQILVKFQGSELHPDNCNLGKSSENYAGSLSTMAVESVADD